jgi:DNA-binding transcriptional regulator GbsR (MarR family)
VPADLDKTEAFVHALLDDPLTVEELVDVTGMPEHEVVTIVTRLIRIGIASYTA